MNDNLKLNAQQHDSPKNQPVRGRVGFYMFIMTLIVFAVLVVLEGYFLTHS